jgi:hypothetical protein
MFMDFLGYGNHVELYSEEISRGGEGLGVSYPPVAPQRVALIPSEHPASVLTRHSYLGGVQPGQGFGRKRCLRFSGRSKNLVLVCIRSIWILDGCNSDSRHIHSLCPRWRSPHGGTAYCTDLASASCILPLVAQPTDIIPPPPLHFLHITPTPR